jgi:hypothetical protein
VACGISNSLNTCFVLLLLQEVLKFWYTEAEISGFLLSDVSYLVEDLSDLTNPNKTINQAENKKILEELLDSSSWYASAHYV